MQSNQRTKRVPKIEVIKAVIPDMNLFVDQSNYKLLKHKYTSKTKTETATKCKSVIGIETLLNTISIALQNGREKNQDSLSK